MNRSLRNGRKVCAMDDADARRESRQTLPVDPLVDSGASWLTESRRRRLLGFASFAFMLFVWFALTGFGTKHSFVDPVFLPSPGAVLDRFVILSTRGYQGASLLHHVAISMMRFGVAFVFCIVAGVGIGLWMGMSSTARALLDPPIEVTRPIPKLALLPLFIIWFGIGEVSKIIVIVSALFPLMSISAMQAVRGVSRRKIQAAYSLGASRWTVFRRVLLPPACPASSPASASASASA